MWDWAVVLVVLSCVAATAPSKQASGQATAKDKEEAPAPEDLVLDTLDRVALAVTYYPPINPGKKVVPVVLLHQFKGSRRDYLSLARYLQEEGHAVVIPDLRGHGRSTSVAESNLRLEADRLRPLDFERMVVDDMEAVNRFLRDKNNAGQLNTNRLCIVGAEMGASVALLYAARDWSWPPYGTVQQGQFVKGLVLISPEWSFKGMGLHNVMRHAAIRSEISMFIAVGRRRPTAVRDAKRIYDMLKPHRSEGPPNRGAVETDLFYEELDTNLQGTNILGQGLDLEKFIGRFIELRLVKAPETRAFEWAEHKPPHG